MNNNFEGLIYGLDALNLKISQQNPPKLKNNDLKKRLKQSRIFENHGVTTKDVTYIMGKEKEKRTEEIFEKINDRDYYEK